MPLPGSYNSSVPQGNQQINNTQQPIETNFQDIANLLAINHVPFNTANTFGKHNFVNYVYQSADPSTASNEMALYSKSVMNDANGAELFYRYPNSGNIIQLTGNPTPSNLTGGGFATGLPSTTFGSAVNVMWQYLSGGVLFMCFNINNYEVPSGSLTNPYLVTFPCGLTGTNSMTGQTGTVVVPSFSQGVFNMQIEAYSQQEQAGPSTNYAATILSKTTAYMYYNGTFTYGSTIPSPLITLIGV